jgi:hypothetical protein
MRKRILSTFFGAMLLAAVPLAADQWDKKTTVTFSGAVELPGIVLPAGTYVFKLADSPSDRHIVQVFNADETHIYTTILAIPNLRLTPKDKTVMPFEERPGGSPEALRAWFYPGDNFGQEFVYPKVRAAQLAETTHQNVLSGPVTPTEKNEELAQTPVVAVTPEKKEMEIAQAPQAAAPPMVAQAAPNPAPIAETPAPAALPKTASSIPTVIVLGLIALGIAGGVKLSLKQSS